MSKGFFSPTEFAELFATTADRVCDLIHSGELRAVNIATNPKAKRPTWRISQQERERFELARQSVPAVKQSRRRKPSYLPANYREVV